MISVKLKLEYKGIPFDIKLSDETVATFNVKNFSKVVNQVKQLIDEILETKQR